MKNFTLPSSHYAAEWPMPDDKSPLWMPLKEMNQLGIDYARLADDDPAKQEKLLQICRSFHNYLMKYLSTICAGRLSSWKGKPNKDIVLFLRYFLSKEVKTSKIVLLQVIRQIHLAFKGKEADEMYDILTEQLLKAIRKYDPEYKQKVKQIVEVLDEKYEKRKQFTLADVNRHLEFDGDSILRMLVRRKHLEKVGENFQRTSAWPPAALLEGEPIGFTYCVQMWFRYYLQQWISHTMSELESKEGVYSLDFRGQSNGSFTPAGGKKNDLATPGNSITGWRDAKNRSWAVDTELKDRPLDLHLLDMSWVDHTEDPLFRDLSRDDRNLLYLVFARELDWKDVAESLGITTKEAKQRHDVILQSVRQMAMEKQ